MNANLLEALSLGSIALSVVLASACAHRMWACRSPWGVDERDPAPGLWRVARPALRGIARHLNRLLPANRKGRLLRLLQQSGLETVLDPAEVVAASLTSGMTVALVCAGLLATLPVPGGALWLVSLPLGAALWPLVSLHRRAMRRRTALVRALPFFLDVVVLAVESGSNLTGALQHAVKKGPPGPLREEVERVLRDLRTGRTRTEALRTWADRLDLPPVTACVAAMVVAERQGSPLGPILRAQAEQRRSERFQLAEKRAMQAPVRMLLPLLLFIFPCTFVLLFFPVVVRLLEEGMLR